MTFIRRLWFFILYRVFMQNFLKFVVGVQFDREFDFKGCEQFIVVANHNSHIDTMIILSSLPWRLQGKVRPIAAQDYFGRGLWRAKIYQLFVGTLLVERKSRRHQKVGPIDRMSRALDEGESLLIYPEGSRGKPGEMRAFKSGAARILKRRPEVPFLPVYLKDTWRTMPKGDGLIVPHLAKVKFGKKTYVDPQDHLVEITQSLRSEIKILEESCF